MAIRMTKSLARPFEEQSDEELLQRALAGEHDAENAFDALYGRREGAVYRFALRMTGSPTLADDVTQDVFLALLRGGHLFDASRGTLTQYLLGMTRNRVLTLLARERTLVPLFEEEGDPEAGVARQMVVHPDPLLDLTRAERVESVRQAILSLPPHYREVLLLCSLEEMSYEQAAEVIGCPVGTVRSRMNRARAMLAERLVERPQFAPEESPRVAYVH
ncbi:MAG: RNA polymerase sigma factor [Blastocatellia bacterium]|nr:RNA polymerase sigma factor [Blastocatellia bacterium]